MNFNTLLDYVEISATLIPLVTYGIYRPRMERWLKFVLIYCTAYIPLAVYAYLLASEKRFNTMVYLVINILFFFCLITAIQSFIRQHAVTRLINVVLPLTLAVFIINAIWGEGQLLFNSRSISISNILLIILSLYYYRYCLNKVIVKQQDGNMVFIEKEPSFWVVTGVFIYCGGTFFLYSLYSSITLSARDFASTAWNINDALLLVMNVCFAKGIRCLK